MPYAQQLKAMGKLIIVAMGPNTNDINLHQLKPDALLDWLNYNNPPANLADRIIAAFHCPGVSCGLITHKSFLAQFQFTSSAFSNPSSASTVDSTSSTSCPCPPPPTTGPVYPCEALFLFLLDASNGVNQLQFLQQINFVGHSLFDSRWTFPQVAIGAYDDANQADFQNIGQFENIDSLASAQAILSQMFYYGDPASITLYVNF